MALTLNPDKVVEETVDRASIAGTGPEGEQQD
jgi:hypothetical protein